MLSVMTVGLQQQQHSSSAAILHSSFHLYLTLLCPGNSSKLSYRYSKLGYALKHNTVLPGPLRDDLPSVGAECDAKFNTKSLPNWH